MSRLQIYLSICLSIHLSIYLSIYQRFGVFGSYFRGVHAGHRRSRGEARPVVRKLQIGLEIESKREVKSLNKTPCNLPLGSKKQTNDVKAEAARAHLRHLQKMHSYEGNPLTARKTCGRGRPFSFPSLTRACTALLLLSCAGATRTYSTDYVVEENLTGPPGAPLINDSFTRSAPWAMGNTTGYGDAGFSAPRNAADDGFLAFDCQAGGFELLACKVSGVFWFWNCPFWCWTWMGGLGFWGWLSALRESFKRCPGRQDEPTCDEHTAHVPRPRGLLRRRRWRRQLRSLRTRRHLRRLRTKVRLRELAGAQDSASANAAVHSNSDGLRLRSRWAVMCRRVGKQRVRSARHKRLLSFRPAAQRWALLSCGARKVKPGRVESLCLRLPPQKPKRLRSPETSYWQWLQQISDKLVGGAAGAAASKRRRRNKQQAQHDNVMSAIVDMVSRLKAPKHKPHRSTNRRPPKPQERPQQQLRGQELARALLEGLETCLNQGGGEGEVLSLLATAVDGRQPPQQQGSGHQGASAARRSAYAPDQSANRWQYGVWKGYRYVCDPITKKWWWDDETWDDETWEWDHNPVPTTSVPEESVGRAFTTPESSRPRKVQLQTSETPADGPKGPRLVACRTQDWVAGLAPKPVTLGALKHQLKEGLDRTGNLVELSSCAEVQELQNLWKAFGVLSPLTGLLTGPALRVTGTFLTRACLTRDKQRAAWEDVGLLQISKARGPWTLPVKSVRASTVPKPSKETVRLVAPGDYRSFFLGSAKDSPVEVVRALAAQVGVPVVDLLGGQWQWQESQGSQCRTLVGYVRVKPEVATKLQAASGTSGVFVSKPGAPEPDSPYWIRRNPKETDEDYLRRVLQLQASRKQPLLHRRGNGANLGFVNRDSDVVASRLKHLVLEGVPAAWDGQDIETFLTSQGWTEVAVLSRKKKRWFLKAMPVKEEASRHYWAYEIQDDEEESWTLRLHVTFGQGGPAVTSVRVPPPSRRQAQREPKSADTESPPSSDRKDKSQASALPARDSGGKGRDRSRSPPPKVDAKADTEEEAAPTALDADMAGSGPTEAPAAQQYLAFPYPRDPAEAVERQWQYEDWGGCGDCFFRCMAAHLAENTTALTKDQVKRDGSWLRLQTIQHISSPKHRQRFSALFATSQKFESWLSEAGEITTYANGTIIQGLAERVGLPVVIWRRTHGDKSEQAGAQPTWQRYVLAPKFSAGVACSAKDRTPIAVKLETKDGVPHYTLIRPPSEASIPPTWLKETSQTTVDLTGAGSAEELSSEYLVGESTPSVHSFPGQLLASGTPSVYSPGAMLDTPSVQTVVAGSSSSKQGHRTPPSRAPVPVPKGPSGGGCQRSPSVHTAVADSSFSKQGHRPGLSRAPVSVAKGPSGSGSRRTPLTLQEPATPSVYTVVPASARLCEPATPSVHTVVPGPTAPNTRKSRRVEASSAGPQAPCRGRSSLCSAFSSCSSGCKAHSSPAEPSPSSLGRERKREAEVPSGPLLSKGPLTPSAHTFAQQAAQQAPRPQFDPAASLKAGPSELPVRRRLKRKQHPLGGDEDTGHEPLTFSEKTGHRKNRISTVSWPCPICKVVFTWTGHDKALSQKQRHMKLVHNTRLSVVGGSRSDKNEGTMENEPSAVQVGSRGHQEGLASGQTA